MTRKIRDEHAKYLAGKTHAEWMAFYRERAKIMEKKIPVLLSELSIVHGGQGDYSNPDVIANRIREKRVSYKKSK